MHLILLHPNVAYRSCEDCIRYVYDHESGKREEWPPHSGIPVERAPGSGPPCRDNPAGCPKKFPESGIELSEKNAIAYRHYLECEAVGNFPDDSIVRQNAAIIRGAEKAVDRHHGETVKGLLQVLVARG